jgi:Actin-like ATPase involved in cell division
MKNLLQHLRDLFSREPRADDYQGDLEGYEEYEEYDDEDEEQFDAGNQPQRFTALDIGTAFAKAMIVEVRGDHAEVLGVGRHPQSYAHMADGIVTDIPGVIANCNEALLKAEEAAGGIIAPQAVIGIAGELVKGSSTTVSKQRAQPTKQITAEELEVLITAAQERLLKNAKERIAAETGYGNIDVRLTNAAVISVRIDGQLVTNPIGFRGRHFALTLFSAFAPLTQLGAIETVAQGLDLTLVTIVAEPYALARCLSSNASADSGAIFIDVGGGTTDIALVRQGGIEETRVFALGGRAFTRRIATSKGIPMKEAERLKIDYSNGELSSNAQDEIQAILAPECQTWMDSVELLIEELSKGELLPPAIYIVGGGSALIDLNQRLEAFPWTERLPFSRQPIIRAVLPEMVGSILDSEGFLVSGQDITPMALAYQAVELNNENNVLERALDRVINAMHI